MKRNRNSNDFSIITLCIIFFTFIFLTIIPNASAGGQDATFDSVEVKADPSFQGMGVCGVGGKINIVAYANFFGGCCYHLYAKDVKAELIVPDNVQIIGSKIITIGTVDAEPGGKATGKEFLWTVTSDQPNTIDNPIYNLEVKVSTSNCGTKSGNCKIKFNEGASISNLPIFPNRPSLGEAITFSAEIGSGNDITEIESATLYIWHNEKDYSTESLMAKEDKVFEIIGDISTNETDVDINNISSRLLGLGKEYQMSQVQSSDTWRIQANDFKTEGYFYYWFNVETTDGKNTTSLVYKETIEDLEKKYQMLDIMIWGTLIAIIIGIVLIIGISWMHLNQPARKMDESGILLIGSDIYTKPQEGKRSNVYHISIHKSKFLILLLFIIFTIILIIISIYLGLFEELITKAGGG